MVCVVCVADCDGPAVDLWMLKQFRKSWKKWAG